MVALKSFRQGALAATAGAALHLVAVQALAADRAAADASAPIRGTEARFGPSGASAPRPPGEHDIAQWLMRVHEASRRRTYVGTFVVWSGAGNMASSRIWHACEGDQQMERVDALTGVPRTTLRRNDQILTFLPDLKVVRAERREFLDTFPSLLQASTSSIPEHYGLRQVGYERVAGFDSEITLLEPRDALRYGYRIWTEKRSHLILKLQTLDTDGRVLEQAAFSELDLDASVRTDKLAQMMADTAGYKVERLEPAKASAAKEGWTLKAAVAGFQPTGCYKRPNGGAAAAEAASTMQWTFSDGLATVSLFVEPYDHLRHVQETEWTMGATHTLSQRVADDWWLTAVGEVPPRTLKAFAQNLVRRK
jgi:sigma-E factor negative regulatory protein RseB